jgi:hypothetical protein
LTGKPRAGPRERPVRQSCPAPRMGKGQITVGATALPTTLPASAGSTYPRRIVRKGTPMSDNDIQGLPAGELAGMWLRAEVLQTDLTSCHGAIPVVEGLHQPDLLGPAPV